MVWFTTYLGAGHDLVEGHQVFLDMWFVKEEEYNLLVPRDAMMCNLVPSLFVRWLQIYLTVWIHAQWRYSHTVPVPTFNLLFESINWVSYGSHNYHSNTI